MQRPSFQVRVRLIFLAVCVLQLLPSASAQHLATLSSDNPYNRRFAGLQAEFERAEPPRQAVLLGEAYRLREFVDSAGDVRDWLKSVAANSSLHQLVRDEAAMRLASVQANESDFAAAEGNLARLGFIRNWSVIGPFSNEQSSPDISAHGYHAAETFPDGRGRSRRWRVIKTVGLSPALKLSNFFSSSTPAVAYAATSVFSESDREVALRFSSEVAVSLFINGNEVFSAGEPGGFALDQLALAVHLHAGWNPVLAKFSLTSQGPAMFALRVTGLQGGGLQLTSSSTRDHEQRLSAATQARATPDDLVNIARWRFDSDPKIVDRLATLGEIEREHARQGDLEHLQAAAQIQPTPDRWLDVARSCRDSACRFDAYSRALRADPKNVDARIGLADYYLSRNQLDRARDILREALEISPHHFLLRDHLAELYLSAGLRALAAKGSAAVLRDFPGPLRLAHSVGTRYADLGLIDQSIPLLRRAGLGDLGRAPDRELLARIYRIRQDAPSLNQLLRQAIAIDPNDTSAIAQLAELEFGAGDRAGAEETMQRAIGVNPDDDALRETFADLLLRVGNKGAADQQFAAALQLNPRLERVRQRLQLVSKAVDGNEESSYLEDPLNRATAASCPATQAGTNVSGISDVRIERVYDNGLSAVRSQQLVCMTSEQGARDFATRIIQYSPETQELKLNHARIYKPDGRVLEGTEAGETDLADSSAAMYYDVRSRTVRFPGVQKGDVVELDYSVTPTASSNPYGDYFATLVPFRSIMPQALQRYVLIAPAKRSLNIVEHSMSRAAVPRLKGDSRIYSWEEHDLPALPKEPRGPALTESAPYVHVSTFASWDAIGRWYAQLIKPQFELDNTLRDVVTRITNGKQTDLEKINAIHEFVLRNTHYVALEFGIYSYKPYPVTQIFTRRFGDCKDKASLMIALLRQAGIDADIALVRTRRLGDIDQRAVSIALFNHAIVYVPKWDLWLDGTAEYAGSRELPLDDQGALALVVALDGSASLRRIPLTKPEDNYTDRVVSARVQTDGTIVFTGTAYTRGEDAPGLRRDFEIAERQRDLFRNSLAEVFPTVHLDDVYVQGANDLERDVSVDFRGTLDSFSGKRVLSLNTSWMPRSYVQTLAPLESRTQDLILSAPWTTQEELRFQLPRGASIDFVPRDTSLDTPFGSIRIQYQRQGRDLIISTSVQFRKLRITPAEYSGFRDFCRQIESAFRAEIKVTLPAA